MAITEVDIDAAGATGIDITSASTSTWTPLANRLYLLPMLLTVGAAPGSTAVDNGTTGLNFVRITDFNWSGNKVLSLWRAMKPSGLSSGHLTLSIGGGQAVHVFYWSLLEFDGVDTSGTDGSGAIGQTAQGQTSGGQTVVSATLASQAASSGTVFLAGWNDLNQFSQYTHATPNSGYTEKWDGTAGGDLNTLFHTCWRADNSLTSTSTLDAGSGQGGLYAVELISATPAATGISGIGNPVIRLPRRRWSY